MFYALQSVCLLAYSACYVFIFVSMSRSLRVMRYYGKNETPIRILRPPYKISTVIKLSILCIVLLFLAANFEVLSESADTYSISAVFNAFIVLFLKKANLTFIILNIISIHQYNKFLAQHGEIPESFYTEINANVKKEGLINTLVPVLLLILPYVLIIVVFALIIQSFK